MGFDDIAGIVRHVLTAIAGGLVTDGFATQDQATQIVGGLMALSAMAWSLYNKRQHRKALAQATQTK